jgi:hypothetical protein
MFGENKNVQMSVRFGRKLVSAILVFSFVTVSLSSAVKAQKGKLRAAPKNTAKQKFSSDLKLDGFNAEMFAGATKISWKTGFELNTLGFRIWRDDKGERAAVNEEMVAGSLLKVGNGVLPAGSEYSFYDRAASANVVYWLEAVDINSQSRWFGPVYPQFSFDRANAEEESKVISGLNDRADAWRRETEKVDFLTPVLKKGNVGEVQNAEAAFVANGSRRIRMFTGSSRTRIRDGA